MSAGAVAALRVLDHGTILDLLAYHGFPVETPIPLTRHAHKVRPAPIVGVTATTRVTNCDGTYGITRTEGVTWWRGRAWT